MKLDKINSRAVNLQNVKPVLGDAKDNILLNNYSFYSGWN